MELLAAAIFITAYVVVTLEHSLRVNKTATAVLAAVLCWTVYMLGSEDHETVTHQLGEHLTGIAEILFFLMAAMTIVELIDSHKGFRLVARIIKTDSKVRLLWIISGITFFLSAILDNLTTSIVMVSLLRKLIQDKQERLVMASMVIIAANSGGAWSPMGDVTTTMLWIGGQVSASNIIKELILPSIVSLLIPLLYQSFFMKGTFSKPKEDHEFPRAEPYANAVFFVGIGALMFVPIFKTVTHLPPYIGMLLGLGVLWLFTEVAHAGEEDRKHLKVTTVLSKIDLGSILFFLGILLAVSALESLGTLNRVAMWLAATVRNQDIIVTLLGLLSAIVDNVPLVAATIGMYPLSEFPIDHKLWEMIAYCAGTGGSILIIGSAAGVVVMGMEKIDFFWYLRKISFTALLGYFAGVITYIIMYSLLH